GGFYSVPTRDQLRPLAEQLRRALDDALATVEWVSGFEFPDLDVEHELFALAAPGAYPIENGDIARSGGPSFPVACFTDHVAEAQVPYSTALHATLDGGRYLTGPLARYSLNSSALSPTAAQAAAQAGLAAECRNPFRSIIVRAVEVVYAIDEALRIIEGYRRPPRPFVEVPACPGTGHGVSEAPRGLLYHRYEIGTEGQVSAATIIPPTSQNQAAIEADLAGIVADNLSLDDVALTALCERLIRSYDPCISCSAHFLTLTVRRG
ncbi:MAG: nickel-dependent hydrogenase large subunit, partial [Mycobacterium sp.]|nr:nickel-dependent hydrogenase large subunit [Mycobacterium sp.]